MAKCKRYDACRLSDTADRESNLCILHSQRRDKDAALFEKALLKHLMKNNDFSGMLFPRGVDFSGTEFGDEARFDNCMFCGDANFSDATFKESVSFRYATFSHHLECRHTQFHKSATFRSAHFANGSKFYMVRFGGGVSFYEAAFESNAEFSYSSFSGFANFERCQFQKQVSFHQSHFEGRTVFAGYRDEKGNHNLCFAFSPEVDFSHVLFSNPEKVVFRMVDFHRVLIANTDLRKVDFSDIHWPEIRRRKRVFDEMNLSGEIKSASYSCVEQSYRDLKQNYENRKDFERASDFHYGEKEMRRLNRDTPRGLRILLLIYRTASDYSESIAKPLVWFFSVLFLSTYVNLMFGVRSLGDGTPAMDPWNYRDWLWVGHYGLRVMMFFRPPEIFSGSLPSIVYTVQTILGPLFTGLTALAIKQSLKR